MKTIPLARLAGACTHQYDIVQREWPNGIPVTVASALRAIELGLDLHWAATVLLDAAGSQAYAEALRPALKTYTEVLRTARRVYDGAMATTGRECFAAVATASRAYDEALAAARKAYAEAMGDLLLVALQEN